MMRLAIALILLAIAIQVVAVLIADPTMLVWRNP